MGSKLKTESRTSSNLQPSNPPAFNRWWWRLVGWGFRQLYTNFAWAYDAVAWAVSRGRWQDWGDAALSRIEGPRVLEIGSGPGHLLASMAAEKPEVWAIDLSPQMVRTSQRRLRCHDVHAGLVRGQAQALPWPDAYFDSVVMTFPAGFILQGSTLAEIARVLHPRGRLVIVDGAKLREDFYGRIINLAFRITAGGGAVEPLKNLCEGAGFAVTVEEERWTNSTVAVLIGAKKDQRASLRPIKRSPLIRQGGLVTFQL